MCLRRLFFGRANLCRAHRGGKINNDSDGITLQMNPGVMRLKVYSPRIIRVTYTAQDQPPTSGSLAVIGGRSA